jgi:hypothetical protein
MLLLCDWSQLARFCDCTSLVSMQLKRMHEPDLLLFVLDLAASEPVIKKREFTTKTQKRSRKACDLEATWHGLKPIVVTRFQVNF